MFTGIIETVGVIGHITSSAVGARLTIFAPDIAPELNIDDSIAVNGICLTVVQKTQSEFAVDAVSETVTRSTIKQWRQGTKVNLERGMPANARFDGHIVQGHVDGTAELVSVSKKGNSAELHFRADKKILDLMVEKGSVALDGISLTVAQLKETGFTIAVIPYTLENTTFKGIGKGARVNVETDIIGKYIAKFMTKKNGLNKSTLQSWGYEL